MKTKYFSASILSVTRHIFIEKMFQRSTVEESKIRLYPMHRSVSITAFEFINTSLVRRSPCRNKPTQLVRSFFPL
jgi:hypothetical protein